ncbi:hypothetical protein PRIPAC_73007 [Pristionchus pacificus]|nr:hypothetical protein PRIPAC_73007 [Pristionchus pacificus]
MPSMQLIAKKSEEEIRKLFFDNDLKKAASSRGHGIVNENAHEWTEVSELRLFSKVVYYKPAGVNRHFNLGQLVKYMNNIFEDEEHCDFAIFLTPEDYKLYQKRKEMTNKPDIIIFKPAYKIRPTPEMIMAKMREMYDMKTVENNEFLPECFTEKSTFNVAMLDKPPERTASQVSLKETDRSISSTPVPLSSSKKSKEENSRSGSPTTSASVAVPGRKKKAIAKNDSRSSSPGVAKKEK